MNLRLVFRNALDLDFHRILYIDRAFVVVNKPSNFITQYPKDRRMEAVAELEGHIPSAPSSTQLFPVHRLDKGTTGCLIFARSPDHAHAFSRQLMQRTVHKTYYALVNTSVSSTLAAKIDAGSIRVRMSLKDGRPHVSQSEYARETWTDWQVIGMSPYTAIALMKLDLHTGMKHQLRVHMSDVLQAPIIGDLQHSGPSSTSVLPIPNDHLFLHASEISFHRFRRTGKQKRLNLTIRAPLPLEFTELCKRSGIQVPLYLRKGETLVDSQPMQDVPDLDGFSLCSSN